MKQDAIVVSKTMKQDAEVERTKKESEREKERSDKTAFRYGDVTMILTGGLDLPSFPFFLTLPLLPPTRYATAHRAHNA